MNMNKPHPFFAAAFSLAFVAGGARAQSEASALGDLSALPVASVASVAGASQAGGASAALPAALAASGAVFVVKGVEASAYATVYTLEGVSDGARISVEIAGRGARQASVVASTVVTATTISTGTVLAAGSEAIAFIPNALGRALLHNERITL
jgi:hypothetical protein